MHFNLACLGRRPIQLLFAGHMCVGLKWPTSKEGGRRAKVLKSKGVKQLLEVNIENNVCTVPTVSGLGNYF